MANWLTYLPITDPTWNFLVVLALILFAPMVLERMRVPSIVGLIFAGIAVGPHGFHILEYDDSFELFGKVGLYYIMFLASLEMNLRDVRKDRNAAIGFGLLTFGIPILLGLLTNWALLGKSLVASLLMASMYASHTLLSYPIVMRYGLSRRRSVNLAVGGTIVADTLTLIVLAVTGSLFREGGATDSLVWLIPQLVGVGLAILIVFPAVCRWFFKHWDDGVVQYIFVLMLVFLGAGLMELIGMEGILGAFLVGLVLNRTIPTSSPLMSHIEFVGNALFIPYFLIGVGMIINVNAMIQGLSGIGVALVMVLTATLGKWLAARISQKVFSLSKADGIMLFGLTGARAAATLAIMLVGSRIVMADGNPLFDADIVNGTMLLILISCLVSSLTTDRAARHIMLNSTADTAIPSHDCRMLVGIADSEQVQPLMNAALVLNDSKYGETSAVSVISSDDHEVRKARIKLLEEAAKIAAAANVEIHTQCRQSVNKVTGMTHCATEHEATDILIGLHRKRRIGDSFFGRFVHDLVSATPQQIIVYRSLMPINTLRKIHIVVPRKAEFEPGFHQWADRIATLSTQLAARVEIYSGHNTLNSLREYWKNTHQNVQANYINYSTFNTFQPIAASTRQDHLVVIVAARPGMPSHQQSYLNRLPEQLERYFSTRSLMVIYPSSLAMAENHQSVLSLS